MTVDIKTLDFLPKALSNKLNKQENDLSKKEQKNMLRDGANLILE